MELRAFLGLLNYYSKFLPNLASKLSPLYKLLHKTTKWTWGRAQRDAFGEAKRLLQSDSLLVHFDEKKLLILACDASPYGVGAVLSHVMEDKSGRPIAYTSRTLAVAEKVYSQLDKEAIAIVFGVKRFHLYLYGRHFVIHSDHQPLSHLFNEHEGVPALASAWLQRWALMLSAYEYSFKYKPGRFLANADGLSHLPTPTATSTACLPGELVLLLNHLDHSYFCCAGETVD